MDGFSASFWHLSDDLLEDHLCPCTNPCPSTIQILTVHPKILSSFTHLHCYKTVWLFLLWNIKKLLKVTKVQNEN